MASREHLRSQLTADRPIDSAALCRLALDALDCDLHEEIVQRFEMEVRGRGQNDRLSWQILGLAHRGLLASAAANAAFVRAQALAPQDPVLAHSVARTALEAGWPAAALFEQARLRSPANAEVLLGKAAAQMAEGQPQAALDGLDAVLTANPGWIEGHSAFARIARMHDPVRANHTPLQGALSRWPGDATLWFHTAALALDSRDWSAARDTVRSARRAIGEQLELDRLEAIALSEGGLPDAAQAIFDRLPDPPNAASLVHPVRNLIRLDRIEQACGLAERPFPQSDSRSLWPYRALLWRISGDPRWDWLEGDERLIRTFDLPLAAPLLAELAAVLRKLHGSAAEPLGQSVRSGSQTDGNLFARAEPALQALHQQVKHAVAEYVADLPPPRDNHPTLIAQRGPLRFAGAWSIRLDGQGQHVDHIHQQGWLSSALYISVPDECATSTTQAGWLVFGENRALFPKLDGFRSVQPRAGRLVLFPSTMWHGTRPISAGERMSVAFDVAVPFGNG